VSSPMAMELLLLDGRRARIDLAARQLGVAGVPAKLGGRAFDLLVALVERRDRVVPKQELLDVVWPGLVVEENNLQVHVGTLRRHLGAQAISTVSGRGYRFAPEVVDRAAPAAPATDFAPDDSAATLLGRDALLAELSRLLARDDVRLVTLTGPGGAGKTRVALRATAQHAGRMRDGAYCIMLAAVRDATHAMTTVASALGLQESSAVVAADLVRAFLKEREILLTLDNLEHLPALAPQLETLLGQAPRLKLLVTSRALTHLPAENEVRVPPLALPPSDLPDALRASPAVQLFARRAQPLGRDVMASPEDLRAAGAICRRVDGLPLAIELAAARLRVLTPASLSARLAQSLPLLRGGAAGAPERHKTLRAAIAWSHALLDPPAQQLFCRLAVFVGGWSLEAAEAMDDEPATVIDRMETLLDHNLVQRVDDVEGAPRYTMLETLREFALEQLAAAGETDALRARHAAFFGQLAAAIAPQVASADRRPGLARLRAELNNLRAALSWLVHERRDATSAVPLVAALTWPWYFEGLYKEGRGWIDQVQALPAPAAAPAARAALLSGAARLAAYSGDVQSAFGFVTESVSLWRELGDRRGLAFALFHEGIAGIVSMQLDRARTALSEARDCFRLLNDAWGIALATSYLGTAYAVAPGSEDAARELLLDGRARFRALGDEWGLTVSSHYLGSIALRTGDHDAARELTQEMLANSRALGDRYRIARNLHQLAEIDLVQGRLRSALALVAESLDLNAGQQRLGDAALQLRLLTRLAQEQGADDEAVRFAALADVHRLADRTMPPDDVAAHDMRVANLRERLGPWRFQALWAEGAAWSIEAAASTALVLSG